LNKIYVQTLIKYEQKKGNKMIEALMYFMFIGIGFMAGLTGTPVNIPM